MSNTLFFFVACGLHQVGTEFQQKLYGITIFNAIFANIWHMFLLEMTNILTALYIAEILLLSLTLAGKLGNSLR